MSARACVDGAIHYCVAGSALMPLHATHLTNITVSGRFLATIYDAVPIQNVGPFGTCTLLQGPCVPATPAPWSAPYMHLMGGGGKPPLLAETAVLNCTVGAVILIADPGQSIKWLDGPPIPGVPVNLGQFPMMGAGGAGGDGACLGDFSPFGDGACGAQAGGQNSACLGNLNGASACGADFEGASACAVAGSLASACGAAATVASACAGDLLGVGACGGQATGIQACAGNVTGAYACGADVSMVDACLGNVTAVEACGADAGMYDLGFAGTDIVSACGADACVIDLVDLCAAEACLIDVIPQVPGI